MMGSSEGQTHCVKMIHTSRFVLVRTVKRTFTRTSTVSVQLILMKKKKYHLKQGSLRNLLEPLL